jgi:hypothetical protein
MENQLESGTLDTLKQGETIILDARQIKGGKVSLQFAEYINRSGVDTKINVLGALNESDARFKRKAKRAWLSIMPADVEQKLGIKLDATQAWEETPRGKMLDLNILNPVLQGYRLRMVITETTEATEYQADNIETQAKRKSKDGDFITTNNGEYIFTNTSIEATNESTEDMHTFLELDQAKPSLNAVEVVETEESMLDF